MSLQSPSSSSRITGRGLVSVIAIWLYAHQGVRRFLIGSIVFALLLLILVQQMLLDEYKQISMEKTTGLSATAVSWDVRSMWSSTRFPWVHKTISLAAPSLESGADARLLARHASLIILTEDFDRARRGLEGIVLEQRGYLSEVKAINPAEEGRSLAAALRVPAARLDAALDQLRKLGRVEEESQQSTDVTENHTDLSARLSNTRRTEQRLLEILARRTGNLTDVINAETKIGEVRDSIEKMERELAGMNSRIAFAAIELRILEDYRARLGLAGASPARRAWNSLVSGLTTAVESLASFGLFLLEYAPALLLWFALLFFPARFVWRRLWPHFVQN